VGRLSPDEQRILVPKALQGISTSSTTTFSQLFNIVLRLLQAVKIPQRGSKEDLSFREALGLTQPEDAMLLAEWFGKLLLLRVNSTGALPSPGLTDADVHSLTLGKPGTWDPSTGGLSLPETRIRVVHLLASGAFTDAEKFMPALYAAASTDYRVSGVGEDMLKRSSVSLEDQALLQKLFDQHMKLPAAYRIRILNLLSKSELATTFTDAILAVFRHNVVLKAEPADDIQHDGSLSTAKPSGLEKTRLHRALFEFINWVARIGPGKADYNYVGPPLVTLLKEFVADQGWPKPQRQSLDDIALRSRAYETIGLLAKGTSMSESDRLSLAGWLFRSLSEDPTADVAVSIDEALSSLTGLFKPPHSLAVSTQLHSILLTYMTLQDGEGDTVRSVRHAVTRWANRCLPFSDVYARWIDILAISGRSGERSEVIEEGHKGLDPWTYYANDDGHTDLPDWQQMTKAFFMETIAPVKPFSRSEGERMDVNDYNPFVNFSAESIGAFPVAVDYCRRILFLTALGSFKLEPGWERRLDIIVQSDLPSRVAIRKYLTGFAHKGNPLIILLRAAFEGMVQPDDLKMAESCAQSFVDIASFSPSSALELLAPRSTELWPLICSNKKELRALGAKAFGILAAHPSVSLKEARQLKIRLIKTASAYASSVGSDLNAAEGSFLALGHLSSRLIYYSRLDITGEISDVGQTFPPLSILASTYLSTQEALFDAYAQLWTSGIFIMKQDTNDESFRDKVLTQFVEPLMNQGKKGNEKAIVALGRLAIALRSSMAPFPQGKAEEILDLILEKLYSLYEIKQLETQFAIGEAITAAVGCWDADVVQLTIDVEIGENGLQLPRQSNRLTAVLQKLFTDCKQTKPSLLKASGIWLFCLIQYCSHLDEIQSRLRECQLAFMKLLSARDEVVQETASRGLSLVYEKGDATLKETLVRDLVSTFTGSGPQLKVDHETELFDTGALSTGDGKSITSYKDIISLANEVGDPSLVYKFMSLATNAATWSTRSAFGRFGLSNILSESEVDPKLYPKLYRYRFDPNPNVQRSMNDIWKAIVKNPGAVLEHHFESIISDLLKSVLGREWRVREASCAAIADLLSGRPFEAYERYYKDIWTVALKVLDDVKATVRTAAFHLCISLSNTLVRQLEESGSTITSQAMMNQALPFLLSDKGIESGVQEVKIFATITVIKIAKSGGRALKPYIPMMVPHLLGLLSTIEPEAINYHYQRAGEDNRERIDKLRSAMVSQSPIAEAIDNCLRNVDDTVMRDLAPVLLDTVKTALGMPTKIGCSRVLSTLSTRHSLSFAPHGPSFLTLLEKEALFDRNDEVSAHYARAAAYVLRVCPPQAQQSFAANLSSLYLASEAETRRQKVADAILALATVSPDHFSALESLLLPFVFLGKHDTDTYVSTGFVKAWDLHAGTGTRVVARYLNEICVLADKCLESAQWALKHAGALSMAAAVDAVIGNGSQPIVSPEALVGTVWPVYDRALALKTFDGKDKLLKPFSMFVKATRSNWESDTKFAKRIWNVAVREAKRNNDAYRPYAFECLWQIAREREDIDVLGEIVDIVREFLVLEREKDSDSMDINMITTSTGAGKKDKAILDLRTQTAWAAIQAVMKGYNRPKMRRDPITVLHEAASALEAAAGKCKTLNARSPCVAQEEYAVIRRGPWYDCVREVLEDALSGGQGEVASSLQQEGPGVVEVMEWFIHTLDFGAKDGGTENHRLARARAAKALIQLVNSKVSPVVSAEWKSEVKGLLEKTLSQERSLDVQTTLRECLDLLFKV